MLHFSDITRLDQNYRFCVQCASLDLAPDAPAWKNVCSNCYHSYSKLSIEEKAKAKHFCSHCSVEIPQDRVTAIIQRGGRVQDCADCSKEVNNDLQSSRRETLISELRASVPAS